MSKDLFDKEISPKCKYCRFGAEVLGGEKILCPKKGVLDPDFSCKKYKYDPLKRDPYKLPKPVGFSEDDFTL